MRPDFTIVTPALNAEAHLGECLESVAQQDADLEHILVDGGSTDATVELGRDAGCRVITGSDHGIYDALQRGLGEAHGRWFVHLNADDLLTPSCLRRVQATAHDHPAAEVVQGVAELFVDTPLTDVVRTYQQGTRGIDPRDLTLGNPVVNARIIRVQVLHDIGGYDGGYQIAGDREMLIRLARYRPQVVSSRTRLYRYRRHTGSLTFGIDREPETFTAEHLDIAKRHLGRGDEIDRLLRVWAARETATQVRRHLTSRPGHAFRWLTYGLRVDPTLLWSYWQYRRGVGAPVSL